MKYVKRNVLIATIVILGLCVSSASVMAAPVVGDITYSPSDATPLSTITFNVTVSGDDIVEVCLIVKECRDDFCYIPKHNVSMTETATTSGKYQADVTLVRPDINNIGYWLIVNSNGIWYDFQDDSVISYLSTTPSDGQQDDGGDDAGGTPGFELVLMLVSIAIIVFMLQRKR